MSQKLISITLCFTTDTASLLQIPILQLSICKEKEGRDTLHWRFLGIKITRHTSLDYGLKQFRGCFSPKY